MWGLLQKSKFEALIAWSNIVVGNVGNALRVSGIRHTIENGSARQFTSKHTEWEVHSVFILKTKFPSFCSA